MDNNFLSRWSNRKLSKDVIGSDDNQTDLDLATANVSHAESDTLVDEANVNSTLEPHSLTEKHLDSNSDVNYGNDSDNVENPDVETPYVENKDDDVDVATLLTTTVESSVKKAALRKLFLSGEFSEVDGLNDYDHDYKAVKSLSSDIAEKLRNWVNDHETPPEDKKEEGAEVSVNETPTTLCDEEDGLNSDLTSIPQSDQEEE